MLDNFKFKTAKEYNGVVADRDNLRTRLEAAETQIGNLENMSVEYTNKINGFAEVEANYKKQIEDIKTAHLTELQNLQAKVETEKGSAEVKAQAIAASMGLSHESQLPKVTNNIVTVSPLEQLNNATSQKEREEIFNNNKTEILKAVGISPEKWEAKAVK